MNPNYDVIVSFESKMLHKIMGIVGTIIGLVDCINRSSDWVKTRNQSNWFVVSLHNKSLSIPSFYEYQKYW